MKNTFERSGLDKENSSMYEMVCWICKVVEYDNDDI